MNHVDLKWIEQKHVTTPRRWIFQIENLKFHSPNFFKLKINMNVETLVLNQHKIKARHKSRFSFVLVLVFTVASASVSASVDRRDDETANETSRRLNRRSPRSVNPMMYDDSVVSWTMFISYLILYFYWDLFCECCCWYITSSNNGRCLDVSRTGQKK